MKKILLAVAVVMMAVMFMAQDSCEDAANQAKAQSDSGVQKASVQVEKGTDGMTVEQRNIGARLTNDNKPGSIKHLYVISPYSGQVIIYSTVKGKVTSGGKRLSPTTVGIARTGSGGIDLHGYDFNGHETGEVLQDDGTYGSSDPYIYWWDVRGIYHQHFLTGGQIVHVSDQPLSVKSVIINIETSKAE